MAWNCVNDFSCSFLQWSSRGTTWASGRVWASGNASSAVLTACSITSVDPAATWPSQTAATPSSCLTPTVICTTRAKRWKTRSEKATCLQTVKKATNPPNTCLDLWICLLITPTVHSSLKLFFSCDSEIKNSFFFLATKSKKFVKFDRATGWCWAPLQWS